MARTALGTVLVGASVVAFVLAFVFGTLAPALVGMALLAYTEGARRRVQETPLSAKRVLARRTAIGDHVKARTIVEAGHDLPVEVYDDVPEAFGIVSRRGVPGRRVAEEHLVLRPREPGTAEFQRLTVRVADPWGLHDAERTIPLTNVVTIAPEPEWAAAGRRIGRRHRVTTPVRRRHATDPSPEIETVREWMPGDRARDIDWAHSSRFQKLMTKDRERTAPRPIHVLLDATATMRLRRRVAKITTAARLAYGVANAAQTAGVQARLIAYTEVESFGASTGRRQRLAAALDTLLKLPAPTPAPDPNPLRLPEAASFTRNPREEAKEAVEIEHRTGRDPLRTALGVLTAQHAPNAFIVAILDAETRPKASEAIVRKLLHRGHKVVVVAPALGAHHFRRGEATGLVLRDLVTARIRREELRRRLAPRHVPVLSLRPDNAAHVLEEVARWAQ